MIPSERMRQFATDHSANAERLVSARQPRPSDDDPLSAARGILIGVPLGLALWGIAWLLWWVL